MVTERELTEAEAAVEAAEVKLDAAEVHHAGAGSETAVVELRAARGEAHAARDRLRFLRTRHAAEHAAERARVAAEAGFSERERKALAKRLAAARDAAVASVVAAERAAAEMLAAVAAYDVTVRAASADLKGRGLSADDGQALGGMTGGVVHFGGEVWRPAEAGSLLGAVMQSAVAEHDARHPLAQLRWGQMGGMAEKSARDELLSKAAR